MKYILSVLLVLVVISCKRGPEGTEPGDCSDGIDNDSDGLVDCEDPGCFLDDFCIQKAAALEAKKKAELLTQKEKARPEKTEDEDKDYIIEDNLWIQKGHNGSDVDLEEANRYCTSLFLAEKNDWRLPSQGEALKAVNSKKLPAESLVMWTSEKTGQRGTIVGMSTGAVNDLGVKSKGQCRARCVRNNN